MSWGQRDRLGNRVRAKAFAKVLRREMTFAERRLWRALREHLAMEATHFRRQVAIGPYVVDFACLKARLVIELDGGQHNEDSMQLRDARRTAELVARGFRVMRFWNTDVISDPSAVIASIDAALGATPTPGPSPQRGGECAHPDCGTAPGIERAPVLESSHASL